MSASIVIGATPSGADVTVDIEELLATRLLVQGNSGSGKSHLLRRLLEESAGLVQQIVIDPEGDFVTLAEPFGHVVVDGAGLSDAEVSSIAARVRQHRVSVVLALDGLEVDNQMRCAARFLAGLFDAPREQWYPAMVVVDEAQLFAPAAAGEVSDDARRVSLAAMTNLMCRGRKRGLAGVIATQRLAKLAKNVAAEASNFLMGRTFLDIDMARAADLLGMERRQAEQIRDLERGHFLGLGPAVSRRPVAVRIGTVRTATRGGAHALMPLPDVAKNDMQALLLAAEPEAEPVIRAPDPPPPSAEVLIEQIAGQAVPATVEPEPDLFAPDHGEALAAILADMAAEEGSTFQPLPSLYQDFSVRARMKGLTGRELDLDAFRRRFAMAAAGIADPADPQWDAVLRSAAAVPDDLLGPYLLIARAAQLGEDCPDDGRLAQIYGTSSPGRIRRLIEHLEKLGLIVLRTDFGGRRSIGIPALGLSTAPTAA
ncbi:ATP-binding protein [Sphingomonas sp. KRR8]|uniref:ATP-binding protein n=1 Tax=Sphingomonas sp. KRR8 TaxID=2942996 RepID=UPI002020D40A|nr:ATP-binding protein [Sphingomonas sp. KRR8]URD60626.1 ATP-binding protein [Sphingomonas sp. KRR8]